MFVNENMEDDMFFRAVDGMRCLVRSRWLGDVCKRQGLGCRAMATRGSATGGAGVPCYDHTRDRYRQGRGAVLWPHEGPLQAGPGCRAMAIRGTDTGLAGEQCLCCSRDRYSSMSLMHQRLQTNILFKLYAADG